MNIFVLDKNIDKCAEYHCDKHVIKMILESAQLLCGAVWMSGKEAPYRLTHKNHPCSLWVRSSLDNWLWLKDLGLSLSREYTKRYGKTHKTQAIIEQLSTPEIESVGLTKFALAMPEEYKSNNPVKSYRQYYINEKKSIAEWRYSKPPKWFS